VRSFHGFIRVTFGFRIAAPSRVDLIPGASKAVVLSDVGTDAAGRAGKLREILEGCGADDRDPPRAMRPWQGCLERKLFSLDFMIGAAELFTEDCGELPVALLALG
jgi:hypothetical protein